MKKVSVKFDDDIYKQIEKKSIKDNNTISDTIRNAIKNYLEIDMFSDNIELIKSLIEETIKVVMKNEFKSFSNRLCGMQYRNNLMVATQYYITLSLLKKTLTQNEIFYLSTIENKAKKMAQNYANGEHNKVISNFCEESIDKKIDYIFSDFQKNQDFDKKLEKDIEEFLKDFEENE